MKAIKECFKNNKKLYGFIGYYLSRYPINLIAYCLQCVLNLPRTQRFDYRTIYAIKTVNDVDALKQQFRQRLNKNLNMFKGSYEKEN